MSLKQWHHSLYVIAMFLCGSPQAFVMMKWHHSERSDAGVAAALPAAKKLSRERQIIFFKTKKKKEGESQKGTGGLWLPVSQFTPAPLNFYPEAITEPHAVTQECFPTWRGAPFNLIQLNLKDSQSKLVMVNSCQGKQNNVCIASINNI